MLEAGELKLQCREAGANVPAQMFTSFHAIMYIPKGS